MSFIYYNNFPLKIIISFLLVFVLFFNFSGQVYVSANSDFLSILMLAASAAAGVGATLSVILPYVVIAVALIGTGYLVYTFADQIVAFAQWLYTSASSMMRYLIDKAYYVGSNVLIMTKPIRDWIAKQFSAFSELVFSDSPTIDAKIINPSYTAIPSLRDIVPADLLPSLNGNNNEYVAVNLVNSNVILYIAGLSNVDRIKEVGTYTNIPLSRSNRLNYHQESDTYRYDVYTGQHFINSGRNQGRLTLVVYDVSNGSYVIENPVYNFNDQNRYSFWSTSYSIEGYEIGLGISFKHAGGYLPYIGSINVRDVASVIGISTPDITANLDESLEMVKSSVIGLDSTRSLVTDFPVKDVTVNVSGVISQPLTNDEALASLGTLFPTDNSQVVVDVGSSIIGKDSVSINEDIVIDTGVVGKPITVVETPTIELTETKDVLSNTITNLLPSFLPNSLAALDGLKNVRVDPPVISINLNKIIRSSTEYIAPDVDIPFKDEDVSFLDFGDLNKYEFKGTPLIEYFRFIIGVGFIYSTFLYVWKKLLGIGGGS